MTGAGDELTIRDLWDQTAHALGDRAAARWLCEVATSLDADDLVEALDEPVTEVMVAHLDEMVARHRAGEPLQYVLGRWGFRGLDLAIDPRVLIPRPETELVAEAAIHLARARHESRGDVEVVDLGTGSGAIGLAVADELPLAGTHVTLTDASADALHVARANLAGIGRAAANVVVREGSWYAALPNVARFDVIVSNPPYVAEGSPLLEASVSEWEPPGALFGGADGLDHVRTIVGGAIDHLLPGGWLVLEIGADQGEVVGNLLTAAGFERVEVRQDLAGHDRVVTGRAPAAAAQEGVGAIR